VVSYGTSTGTTTTSAWDPYLIAPATTYNTLVTDAASTAVSGSTITLATVSTTGTVPTVTSSTQSTTATSSSLYYSRTAPSPIRAWFHFATTIGQTSVNPTYTTFIVTDVPPYSTSTLGSGSSTVTGRYPNWAIMNEIVTFTDTNQIRTTANGGQVTDATAFTAYGTFSTVPASTTGRISDLVSTSIATFPAYGSYTRTAIGDGTFVSLNLNNPYRFPFGKIVTATDWTLGLQDPAESYALVTLLPEYDRHFETESLWYEASLPSASSTETVTLVGPMTGYPVTFRPQYYTFYNKTTLPPAAFPPQQAAQGGLLWFDSSTQTVIPWILSASDNSSITYAASLSVPDAIISMGFRSCLILKDGFSAAAFFPGENHLQGYYPDDPIKFWGGEGAFTDYDAYQVNGNSLTWKTTLGTLATSSSASIGATTVASTALQYPVVSSISAGGCNFTKSTQIRYSGIIGATTRDSVGSTTSVFTYYSFGTSLAVNPTSGQTISLSPDGLWWNRYTTPALL
jgi:hypothetical protein